MANLLLVEFDKRWVEGRRRHPTLNRRTVLGGHLAVVTILRQHCWTCGEFKGAKTQRSVFKTTSPAFPFPFCAEVYITEDAAVTNETLATATRALLL